MTRFAWRCCHFKEERTFCLLRCMRKSFSSHRTKWLCDKFTPSWKSGRNERQTQTLHPGAQKTLWFRSSAQESMKVMFCDIRLGCKTFPVTQPWNFVVLEQKARVGRSKNVELLSTRQECNYIGWLAGWATTHKEDVNRGRKKLITKFSISRK